MKLNEYSCNNKYTYLYTTNMNLINKTTKNLTLYAVGTTYILV